MLVAKRNKGISQKCEVELSFPPPHTQHWGRKITLISGKKKEKRKKK
jgi:hypothetical protein